MTIKFKINEATKIEEKGTYSFLGDALEEDRATIMQKVRSWGS